MYGGGGRHYSKYTQQVSFREPGWTDNVKTVYPPTSTVCGGYNNAKWTKFNVLTFKWSYLVYTMLVKVVGHY